MGLFYDGDSAQPGTLRIVADRLSGSTPAPPRAGNPGSDVTAGSDQEARARAAAAAAEAERLAREARERANNANNNNNNGNNGGGGGGGGGGGVTGNALVDDLLRRLGA